MDIRIESLMEGAARASGVVAVIDVLRAFTSADVPFALEIGRYEFAIKVEMENGYPVARTFEA